jgi:hypothetical protein
MGFDPAKWPTAFRIGDLIAKKMLLGVHCNKCGRFRTLDPAAVPIANETYVPALDRRFKCTRCGSRETQARPHFPSEYERGR